MKIVCMIPARMGSKRIIQKNIVDLGDGQPLMSHVIKAAKASNCFDDIYVNSESNLLGRNAKAEGVEFYKRPEHLSTDTATNDDFTLDFLKNIECDYIVQLLTTSPFITEEEIRNFTSQLVDNDLDTLISVKDTLIECVYDGEAINFDKMKPTPPSQDLTPIKAYACTLMGWKKDKFISNMKEYGCAYHGGAGRTEFFTIEGFSEVDIDTPEDLELARAVWSYLNDKKN